MLKASRICKSYVNGKDKISVLNDVSFNIEKGQIAAILGPSGAGKSTLLHIIGGLDSPSSGEVLFEGEDISVYSDKRLSEFRNSCVGFVFQFYHLLPEFNILENIIMPYLLRCRTAKLSRGSLNGKAMGLLERIGLSRRINNLPSQLSGGEQQRVAIARALFNEPKLLLCDEPTGNLDSENSRNILELLKSFNSEKKMAIVMVTHNLDIADSASKIYNIRDGELASR